MISLLSPAGTERHLPSTPSPSGTAGRASLTLRMAPQEILEEYNESNTRMDLVLFDDALEHLTRVHRIIRLDRGHALLVGVGGSGKQSLAKLAAFTAGYEVSALAPLPTVGGVSFTCSFCTQRPAARGAEGAHA